MEKPLRNEIYKALSSINNNNAPKVNEAIKTVIGYKNIEEQIIKMVVEEGLTPLACIPHIENSL